RVVVAYLASYVFLDWVSYVHPVLPIGITPWNPPPGLSLFLLLVFGLRYWPLLFAAALAADVIVRGVPAPWPVLLEAAALLTGVYTLAAFLLKKYFRDDLHFVTARDLGIFLAVVIPATLLVSTTYVALFMSVGRVPAGEFLPSLFRHWVGDLNGILVFTPALLTYTESAAWRKGWSGIMKLEIAAQTFSIAFMLWAIFGLTTTDEFKFFYLLFLPLIWISVRWGMRGATLALIAIQLGLIAAVQLGGYHAATFVQFQFLMLALCVTGLVLGTVVTQRMQVETKLSQKQAALNRALQFAAAGEMTSALAHELNQPIAAVTNYLRACQALLRADAVDQERLDGTMEKAVQEARRAGAVVHRLRDFFRRGSIDLRPVAVDQLIGDAVNALRDRAAQAGVRIQTRISATILTLSVDPTQIAMVLHNLIANAIEAISSANPARREIDITVTGDTKNVRISIEDAGPGIDPDVAASMFEPFVTSKPEGMGLGLAIGRTLVRAHGGELHAENRERGGARFVLTLPVDTGEHLQ
ncbi:MAG TPA: ATP-binding protein, partial [Gammaproteobacteria bacterium]